MRIRITSDSTCDLNPDYLQAHRVEIVPLYTYKGGETFRDGVDIMPADIFAHVAAGGDLCSTAANNVGDYQEVFARVLQDCDAIIHVDISADFSSCYQSACVAAESFPGQVYVVDSRNLSSGHGHIVCEAVKMAEAGELTAAEIREKLIALTSRVEASFLLDLDTDQVFYSQTTDSYRDYLEFVYQCYQDGIIMIIAEQEGDSIRIAVSDTGENIPAFRLQEINDAHEVSSTSGTAYESGTSIGLKLCHTYLHALDSRLVATSGDGVTTFEFTIKASGDKGK